MKIDIKTATRDELIAYAKDVKGMRVSGNIGTETLREKLIGSPVDSPATEPEATEATPAPKAATAQKMVKIIIQETDDETGGDDAYIGINGEIDGKRVNGKYQIQRGEEVEVPDYLVDILRNAKKTVYTTKVDRQTGQTSLLSREVLSYPFQIVG